MKSKKPPLFVVDPTQPNRAMEIVEEASQDEAIRFVEAFGPVQQRCESPIEELLLAALYAVHNIGITGVQFCAGDQFPATAPFDETIFVYQQVPIGQYRVDILILDASLPFEIASPRYMIIECDGHDFHERTKEQARRDKRRDRFFQSKGFKVLRFTGSEIWASPENCADEIIDELANNDAWRNRDR